MDDAYTNHSDGQGCRDWRPHLHSSSTAGQAPAIPERPNPLRLQPGELFSSSYSGPTPYARPPAIALGQMSRWAGAAYSNARSASGSYVLGQRIQNSPAAACEFAQAPSPATLPNASLKRTPSVLRSAALVYDCRCNVVTQGTTIENPAMAPTTSPRPDSKRGPFLY
jgi:hypothetical protein